MKLPDRMLWSRGLLSSLVLTFAALALSAQGDPGGPVGGTGGGGYRGPGDTVPSGVGSAGGVAPAPGALRPAHPSPGAPPRPVVVRPRIPPPGAPGSPFNTPEETPSGRPMVEDETSWQHWWHYNKWAYLSVEQGLADVARTGSGGFFLGRGERKDDERKPIRATPSDLRDVVFPALARVLQQEDTPDLVSQALLALAKLRVEAQPGQKSFWQIAPRALTHANASVVENAVLALGVNGDERFLRWLESILADEPDGQARLGGGSVPERVRAFSAFALGLLAERSDQPVVRARVFAALSRGLHGDSREVQGAALVAMGHVLLGWEPLAADAAPSLLLTARSRPEAIAEVLAFLADETVPEETRAHAPVTLARLLTGAPEDLRASVASALLALLSDQSRAGRELQNGAVLALGGIADCGELPIDRRVRAELERIALQATHHRLTRYMAGIALAQAASRPGHGAQPFDGLASARKLLVRQIDHSRGQTLCWSALALGILERDAGARGEMPAPEVCDGLRKMLQHNRTPEVAGAAAIALGLIRDVESVPALYERMLDTGEAHVRGYCALALGMIGATAAVDGVHAVVEAAESQPFALQQAAIGLGLLGDQSISSLLFSLLSRASDPEVQASIAAALGWLRDPRPIGPLAERLADTELGATPRTWTAVALGRICDVDPWPWVARWSVGANYDAPLASLVDEDFKSGLLDLP